MENKHLSLIRGPSIPKLFFTGPLAMLLLIGGLAAGCRKASESGKGTNIAKESASTVPGERKVLFYRNPMNPAVTSPSPAKDSMGMDYVPVYADEAGAAKKSPEQGVEDFFSNKPQPKSSERKVLFYRNPMNPAVTSPAPAKDEMGMDYIPVYADEAGAGGGDVPGLAPVTIPAEGIALAGVRTTEAVMEPIRAEIRTVGQVLPDETRVRRVQTKVGGWVEKLFVNFTGQQVRQGEPILSIYSPELLAGQEEFLRAKETSNRMAASSDPETRGDGERIFQAARRRLELFDVPASFLAGIEKSGKPERTVTLVAPVSGYVTAKDVLDGQKIEAGMALFTVADLSRVWVEADVYEYEARNLKPGIEATLALPYDPGKDFPAKVAYVYPVMNPETRTLKVRFEVPNQSLYLKPGMFADVTFSLDAGEGITVPDSAVMDTGARQVVFVERGGGRFEPRLVKAGVRRGGKAQIVSGLSAGERVVTGANFLLDSESRLQAVIQKMTEGAK